MEIRIGIYSYMCICVYMCVYVCVCMYVCMYAYMYIYRYVYIYIHIYIYIYIYKDDIDGDPYWDPGVEANDVNIYQYSSQR
jgi:hypothetical protein